MRRRPIKTGWRLLITAAVVMFPLLFVLIWLLASRFTHNIWQVSPLLVTKWSVLALLVVLLAMFIEQRARD